MNNRVVRRFYTYNQLLGAARTFLKQSRVDSEFDNAMACALFCALALEASLNHLGSRLFPFWDKQLKRKLTPEGKLTLVASKINFTITFARRPFQAFRVLFEFRNQITHGTTEDLKYESSKNWLKYGDHRWPATKWEMLCNSEQASALICDTELMIDELFAHSGIEKVPRFLLSEHVKRND
jgi:hypothetical protein